MSPMTEEQFGKGGRTQMPEVGRRHFKVEQVGIMASEGLKSLVAWVVTAEETAGDLTGQGCAECTRKLLSLERSRVKF